MNDYAAAYGAASALARVAIDEGRESIGDERADYMLQLLDECDPTPKAARAQATVMQNAIQNAAADALKPGGESA